MYWLRFKAHRNSQLKSIVKKAKNPKIVRIVVILPQATRIDAEGCLIQI